MAYIIYICKTIAELQQAHAMPTCLVVNAFKTVVDATDDLEFCLQDSAGGWILLWMYYMLMAIVFTKVNGMLGASLHYL